MRCARFVSPVFVSLLALALGGCQSVGCGTAGGFGPQVQLLYPAPGATNVPDDVGVIVFVGSYPPERLPIALSIGMSPPSIQTSPLAVPAPIPSPAATPEPEPSGETSVYAVAVQALSGATTYSVLATETSSGCINTGAKARFSAGTFTTK